MRYDPHSSLRPFLNRSAKYTNYSKDASRPSSTKRGYGKGWAKLRKVVLSKDGNQACVRCGRMAQVVDHKEPIIYGGKVLDEANCQPMCEDCNKAKAAQDKQKYEAKGIAPLWGAGSKQTAIKP